MRISSIGLFTERLLTEVKSNWFLPRFEHDHRDICLPEFDTDQHDQQNNGALFGVYLDEIRSFFSPPIFLMKFY